MRGTIQAPRRREQPVNLLDNSDFTNPINQRGQTSITGPFNYFIDRWIVEDGSSNISNGVNVSSGHLVQRIPTKNIRSAKVTLAACDSGGNVYVGENAGIVYSNSESYDFYTIKLNPGRTYIWATLYEGAYTADTLPLYIPKGYAVELVECQRYYWQIHFDQYETIGVGYAGPAYSFVQLSAPVQMKTKYPILAQSAPVCLGTDDRIFTNANCNGTTIILGVNYPQITNPAGSVYGYSPAAGGVTFSLSADL